jgi:hypothetical protein
MTSIDSTDTTEAHKDKIFTIVVDTVPREVSSDIVSYEQVVEFAYPGQLGQPNVRFAVTYRHAKGESHRGTLTASETVEVKKEGTFFNVKRTTKS